MIGIIGSSGFIGRTIKGRLAKTGLPLRAFSRSSPEQQETVVDHVSFIRYSMTDPYDPALFEGLNTLVLCASATRPNTPANSPQHEWLANIAPHLSLFGSLLTSDVTHIVYMSSGGAVYGNCAIGTPIDEDTPCKPVDAYGYGKLCLESSLPLIWKGESRAGPRRFTIVRPANPIGKYQLASVGTHGLVTTVLHQLLNDRHITVQGDGLAVRDYFAADDLADLVVAVVTSDHYTGNCIVNASSGRGMTILEVIEACATHLKTTPDIRMLPGSEPAVHYSVLNSRRAQKLFGWSPRVNFSDSLTELVDAIKTRDRDEGRTS